MEHQHCVVCMESPAFWAWSDCTVGATPVHKACVCWPCMVKVVDGGKTSSCPWCRGLMTTIQKVTGEMIQANVSTQDALESMKVGKTTPPAEFRVLRMNFSETVLPHHFCYDCGEAVFFQRDRCVPCFARWRREREVTGLLPPQSQRECSECGRSVRGLTSSCMECFAYRTRENLRVIRGFVAAQAAMIADARIIREYYEWYASEFLVERESVTSRSSAT